MCALKTREFVSFTRTKEALSDHTQWRTFRKRLAKRPCKNQSQAALDQGKRLKPSDVMAIHDPRLGVEIRREEHLGVGDLARETCFWNGGSPCDEFGVR